MRAEIRKGKYVAVVEIYADEDNELIPHSLWNYVLGFSDSSCGNSSYPKYLWANIPTNYFPSDMYKLDSVIAILRAKCSEIIIDGEVLK